LFLPLKDDNPAVRTPWITILLVAANAAAYLFQLFGGVPADRLVFERGLIPARFLGVEAVAPFPFTTLLTSMFLHGGLVHLGGNLLYLWIFGNNIEDVLGHAKFLVFYVLAGLGGHLAHLVTNASSEIPTIGASGAIAGVLGAYLIGFPGARVLSLVFIVFFIRLIRVPAGLVIGLWLLTQVVGGFSEFGSVASGGIAWFEHLGGFIVGVILFRIWCPARRRWAR
jgi:membrane associated rhomboid family serine protease